MGVFAYALKLAFKHHLTTVQKYSRMSLVKCPVVKIPPKSTVECPMMRCPVVKCPVVKIPPKSTAKCPVAKIPPKSVAKCPVVKIPIDKKSG